MNREAVRMLLASQDQDDFDKINDQKILGAEGLASYTAIGILS